MIFSKLVMIRCPWFFRRCIKRIKTSSRILYLTFDDGPTPEITGKVLEILKKYNARASFFCIGKNAEAYPEILDSIKSAGHTVGNHGYSHLNAFKVSYEDWFDNMTKDSPVSDSEFFRPPYGFVRPFRFHKLSRIYKVVFWDVLSYDFRKDIQISEIREILYNKIRNGSIIVFHDSNKAVKNMLPALEYTLEYFSGRGYEFRNL